MEKHDEKKEWTEPTVTEFEVSERTQSSDGTAFDGQDPEPAQS